VERHAEDALAHICQMRELFDIIVLIVVIIRHLMMQAASKTGRDGVPRRYRSDRMHVIARYTDLIGTAELATNQAVATHSLKLVRRHSRISNTS